VVLMFTWDVYGDRFGQNVTLRREENGYKRMCLGRLCIYFVAFVASIGTGWKMKISHSGHVDKAVLAPGMVRTQ